MYMEKFISPRGDVLNYSEYYTEVDGNVSPFKEILKKKDYSSFSFANGDEEAEPTPLKGTFHLQVNAKGIGTFHFIFLAEGFNRDGINKEISTLKDFEVTDFETAKYKVSTLINIVKEHNPLFAVYKEITDSHFYSGELQYMVGSSFPIFVILSEVVEDEVQELDVGMFDPNALGKGKKGSNVKKPGPNTKITRQYILEELENVKFHLLLLGITTLLMQVSIPLGILNVYSNNLLYIFLFICGAVGIVMNGFSNYDFFRTKKLKSLGFLFSVIANVIGMGAGIGVFAIFYNISSKAEGAPNMGAFILIGILVTVIVCVASVIITYYLPKKAKKK